MLVSHGEPQNENLKLFGFFEDEREVPTYEPGTEVSCLLCGKPLNYPANAIKTISIYAFFHYAPRSYFYRTHKECYESTPESEIGDIEGSVMGFNKHMPPGDMMRPGLFLKAPDVNLN